jgi:hypothetical protein
MMFRAAYHISYFQLTLQPLKKCLGIIIIIAADIKELWKFASPELFGRR